ncbi:MAG TPA: hypothetical protein VJZ27_18420, partial [Aggregatilineales bacterium]|nr:hypothetical protein [Aggregatilineales bacterium]
YPVLSAGLGRGFVDAVGLYSAGRYEDAFVIFRQERENINAANITCEPATYYYEILGMSEIGDRRSLEDARSLYEDALARPGCDESPMIYTGACVTDYLTFLDSGDVSLYTRATGWCDAALEKLDEDGDRIIPVTATTRARLYMLEQPPNFRAAAAILDEALAVWPADLNLLLVRARVEINRGDLQEALRFISQALFVDPASEQALRLRVEAYMDIAGQINDPQQKILLYCTAVIWTQEYLIFYPGEPAGYLLMARARLGEGNDNLAEEALNRIIAAENELPETDAILDALARAHALRASIYKESGRYEQALDEIDFMLQGDPDNLALIREQTDLAFRLNRYNLTMEGITALLEAGVGGEENTRLQLLRLRLTTQICEFTIEIECDYPTAAETLTEDFLATLSEAQALEARSYRAKAVYHVTVDADDNTLNQNQRTLAYQQVLADLDLVLAVNENPVDVYYRGLVLQELEETDSAVRSYEWLEYWSQFYEYPFMDDVQARLEELRPPEETAEDAA